MRFNIRKRPKLPRTSSPFRHTEHYQSVLPSSWQPPSDQHLHSHSVSIMGAAAITSLPPCSPTLSVYHPWTTPEQLCFSAQYSHPQKSSWPLPQPPAGRPPKFRTKSLLYIKASAPFRIGAPTPAIRRQWPLSHACYLETLRQRSGLQRAEPRLAVDGGRRLDVRWTTDQFR